jgi:hypothetical protein
MSVPERRAMVERPGETLSVRRQCELLNLARSGVYRRGPVTTARGEWRSNSTRPATASTASACKG